jgi:hypothetical protein
MAGPGWHASGLASEHNATPARTNLHSALAQTGSHTLYLPLVIKPLLENPPSGCPCGWFDDLGRMLYYTPSDG